MERKKVKDSSNITEIGYDEVTRVLELKFHNGKLYKYWPISQFKYNELIKADSMGSHFYKKIRGNPEINYQQITDTEATK